MPRVLPVSHLSYFSPLFHQVAADLQVFRFVQQLTACRCQSRRPQGRNGGGCQQSGDLQGTPLCSSLLRQTGCPKGVLFVRWSSIETLRVSLCLTDPKLACWRPLRARDESEALGLWRGSGW